MLRHIKYSEAQRQFAGQAREVAMNRDVLYRGTRYAKLILKMGVLYQIALPATHLRRYSGLVTAIQVFDLTHVYDAIISAQHRVI